MIQEHRALSQHTLGIEQHGVHGHQRVVKVWHRSAPRPSPGMICSKASLPVGMSEPGSTSSSPGVARSEHRRPAARARAERAAALPAAPPGGRRRAEDYRSVPTGSGTRIWTLSSSPSTVTSTHSIDSRDAMSNSDTASST